MSLRIEGVPARDVNTANADVKKEPLKGHANVRGHTLTSWAKQLSLFPSTVEITEQAHARFCFLRETKPQLFTEDKKVQFSEFDQFLQNETACLLKTIFDTFHPHRLKAPDFFENRALLFENRFVVELAKALLCSGELNFWLVDDIKKQLKIKGANSSALDQELFVTLDALKNLAFQQAFKKIGTTSKQGMMAVGATLALDVNQEVSASYVRQAVCQAVLANFLVRFRHMDYHSCYAYSVSNVAKRKSPELVIEEFNDILQHGALTRNIDGKECKFLALPKMTSYHLVKELNSKIKACNLWEQANLQCAFTAIGADQLAVDKALKGLKKAGKKLTLFTLFSELKTNFTGFKKEGLKAAELFLATLTEMPLLRMWNNAIAGMFFTPFTSTPDQISTHTVFKRALVKTLAAFVEEAKESNAHCHSLLAMKDAVTASPCFTAPHFAPLERVRIFVRPPIKIERRYAECHLYVQGKKGDAQAAKFKEIKNEKELGVAFKELFLEVLKNMQAEKAYQIVNGLSSEFVGKKFSSIFDPLFAQDLAYDPLYENKPWSFLLGPAYFDTFWKIYYDASLPSQKISFANKEAGIVDLLQWAVKMQKKSTNPNEVVAAKYPGNDPVSVYPGHAVFLTPNHPTMIPKDGQTVEAMLKEKMQIVKNITVSMAPNVVKEAKRWSVHYLETNEIKSKAIAKFQKKLEKIEENEEQKLTAFLQTLVNEIQKITEKETVEDVSLDELAVFCLQELLTDVPQADDNLVIHFGDSMWEYEPEGAKSTIPIDVCFYPDLISQKWSMVYLASTSKYSFVKQLNPPELSISM